MLRAQQGMIKAPHGRANNHEDKEEGVSKKATPGLGTSGIGTQAWLKHQSEQQQHREWVGGLAPCPGEQVCDGLALSNNRFLLQPPAQ